MHSAVMQNKKYIKFAAANTVEVLSMGRLDEAIEKGNRKAGTYEKKGPDGQTQEYMVAWPSLTRKQINDLRAGPAGRYNRTGGIPYTCIVDPHTLNEIQKWSGGISPKTIMEAVTDAKKALQKEHGKGLGRSAIKAADKAVAESRGLTASGDFDKAIKALAKARKKDKSGSEIMTQKFDAAQEAVVEAARTRLSEVKQLDGAAAKKAIGKLMRKLKGTGLEDEAKLFKESLATD